MNRMIRHIRIALLLAAVAAGMHCMQSCISDADSCPVNEETRKGGIHLRFTIMTRNEGKTKAADIEGEQVGAGYENFLDVKDIKYLIFDKDRKFITDITAKTETVAENASYTVYNVVANIDEPYFYDNLNGIVDFYILCLANHSGWGIKLPTLGRGDGIDELFTDGLVMTELPETYKLQNAAKTENVNKQYFPMSGLQHFRVPGSMLMTSSEGAPYDLSFATGKDLNLLRALAKIEIIDKINIVEGGVFDEDYDEDVINGNGRFRIDKVEINGYMTQGSLLPAFSQWNVFETQQVTAPTIPNSAEYVLPPVLNADNSFGSSLNLFNYRIDFEKDEYAKTLRADKCPVFSGYVYEYLRTSNQMAGIPITQQPYFRVTTRGYTASSGQVVAESMVFPVRMANYTNGVATSANNLPQLLRNHIYRFEISGIGQDITVKWTVCDMDNASADIEFN